MPAIPFNPFGVEPIQSLQSLNLPSLASLSQRDSDIMLQSSMQNLSQSLGYDASLTSPTVIFRSPPTSLMAIGAQTQAQGSTEPVPGPLPTNQAAEPMPDTADAYAMSSIHKYFEIPTPTIHNNNLNGDDQADTNAIAPEFFYF
ncbi:hypothetical protein GGI12_002502 [Dipsacomyces acuminosporus]|nr:hypothetical protein GGI12_002502 [Dipsacomyces acuminosporus]